MKGAFFVWGIDEAHCQQVPDSGVTFLLPWGQAGVARAESRGKDSLGGWFAGLDSLLIHSLKGALRVAWETDSCQPN